MSATGFQPMPELTTDERDALAADIAERGIIVPVVLDQHGRTLDGHHRQEIAAELKIHCPTEIRHVGSDDEAHDVAVSLNLARRHLTREQRRQLIADEIARRPDDSDRAIARRCGCDHKTVGSVRRERSGEVPHRQAPDELTPDLAAMERTAARLGVRRGALLDAWDDFHRFCDDMVPALLKLVYPSVDRQVWEFAMWRLDQVVTLHMALEAGRYDFLAKWPPEVIPDELVREADRRGEPITIESWTTLLEVAR